MPTVDEGPGGEGEEEEEEGNLFPAVSGDRP